MGGGLGLSVVVSAGVDASTGGAIGAGGGLDASRGGAILDASTGVAMGGGASTVVAMGVGASMGMAMGAGGGVDASTGVSMGVDASTGVSMGVDASTGVAMGVDASTGVAMGVDASTGVSMGVDASTGVAMGVDASTGVAMGAGVGVIVAVLVGVGVGDGAYAGLQQLLVSGPEYEQPGGGRGQSVSGVRAQSSAMSQAGPNMGSSRIQTGHAVASTTCVSHAGTVGHGSLHVGLLETIYLASQSQRAPHSLPRTCLLLRTGQQQGTQVGPRCCCILGTAGWQTGRGREWAGVGGLGCGCESWRRSWSGSWSWGRRGLATVFRVFRVLGFLGF